MIHNINNSTNSKNKINLSTQRVVNNNIIYSDYGGRISSPATQYPSNSQNPSQPNPDLMVDGIITVSGPNGTITAVGYPPQPLPPASCKIDLPVYNQGGSETGPHDPNKGTGTCQCATSLSLINAALRNLPNMGDNPQIDLNHLYHCFPIGKFDPDPGDLSDPRANPRPRPVDRAGSADAAICEYIVATMMKGKCFPVKIRCNQSDTASRTDKSDCSDNSCIKNIRLKNVRKPPNQPTFDETRRRICSGKPIILCLKGKLLDDLINDNEIGNHTPGIPNNYTWPGVGGHGFENLSHVVLLVGYTHNPPNIILHCQNSWGSILTYFNIIVPENLIDQVLDQIVAEAKGDLLEPVLWDFDVVDCDWFDSPICCSSTPVPSPTPTPTSPYVSAQSIQLIP